MRLIGDIHGDKDAYLKAIGDAEESIQVGDFGVGFVDFQLPDEFTDRHRFIRGNHDHPDLCKVKNGWIDDGKIEGDVMFVGGAKSIDRQYRVEGVSWWRNEELSYSELMYVFDEYLKNKPRVMITHDCPDPVAVEISRSASLNKYEDKSVTRQAFTNMWMNHKPEIWAFGHWHHSFDRVIMGTRFICLNINEAIDLEI